MDKTREKTRFNVFLGSIILHSILGTCDRLRTACGIVNGKRLRGIGYNGSINKEPHCDDIGHLMVDNHCLRTRHGEKNAVSNTDRRYLPDSEAIIIATPCLDCIKDLIHEGVKMIHYVGSYANARGQDAVQEMVNRQGVIMHQFNLDFQELFQSLFDRMAQKGGVLYRSGYRLVVTKEPLEKSNE